MGTAKWLYVPVLSALLLLAMACGDDVVDGENSGANGLEGCPAGYVMNPINGQCVSSGSEDGDGDSHSGDGDGGDSASGDGDGDGDSTGGDGDPQEQPCGSGRIVGQACTPDQHTLPGANITVSGTDCDGNEFEINTQADNGGNFTLENVPAGDHELVVRQGSFSGTQIVRVHPNDTTEMTGDGKKACLDGAGVPIAVLGGAYDNVGGLLNSLEIEFDRKGDDALGISTARSFLSDYNAMSQYQILFIECGGLWDMLPGFFGIGGGADMNQVKSNLRTFVESGRSLYVSDQAHPFIAEVFPEAVNFYTSNPQRGNQGQTIQAEVTSAQMLTLLGQDSVSLYFDSPGWVIMESAQAPTVTHFRGNAAHADGTVQNAPLLISYSNPAGGVNGTAIFTSFHNSQQGNMGGDMGEVLRFLIFQL